MWKYINKCSTCAVNLLIQYKIYKQMQSIKAALSFEFIAVDFVFKLLESKFNGNIYDKFIFCTDLAFKMITLISDHETYL